LGLMCLIFLAILSASLLFSRDRSISLAPARAPFPILTTLFLTLGSRPIRIALSGLMKLPKAPDR